MYKFVFLVFIGRKALYGVGNGYILIHDVYCLGSESRIIECTYNDTTVDLNHRFDVGVQCYQGYCFSITVLS